MERETIERAVRLGGLALRDDLEFEVAGAEPVLPSPHYLASATAAARILTGAGANELWRLRTGRTQALSVDLRHAAAALRSYELVGYVDGEERAPVQGELPGPRFTSIMAARDGRHVQMHNSFTDTRQILDELGLDASVPAEAVQAAVAQRDAFELEDAFMRRRVCGAVVRTREEWAAHSQGRALAAWPVVRITRIGDAPPEPLPPGDRPASGIRVVDLTRVLAGPTCAKTLAEHGAEVLHVTAPRLPTIAGFDVETGIGKRQAELDLDDAAQAETMRALVAEADVFSQGYRLGAMVRRDLGPEQLAELRPGVVYVEENCYGHDGPWAERPGWDQLASAVTGMSHREGIASGDGTPRLAPAYVNDYCTGYFAAYGTMLALARRASEGGSWLVQVSLCRTAMWCQELGDDNAHERADAGDLAPFLGETVSPDFGRLRYLKPALRMSETEPRWELPPVRAGAHAPAWAPRASGAELAGRNA